MINQMSDLVKITKFYGYDIGTQTSIVVGTKDVHHIKLEFYQLKGAGCIVQISYYNDIHLSLNTKRLITFHINYSSDMDDTIVKCVSKKNVFGVYKRFLREELKFLYENGFSLCPEQAKQISQTVEEWF